ncbi:MAG: hypothetical protein R6V53_05695 [Candidatus Woesearchaeota archaeon]
MRVPLLILITVFAFLVNGASYSTGDTIDIDGKSYTLTVPEDDYVLIRDGSEVFYDLDIGDCEEWGDKKYCFTGKPSNTTATLETEDLEAEIELTYPQNESDLLVGERREINIKFRNSGNHEAENLTLVLELPKDLIIEETEGCTSYRNVIMWNGTLDKGKEHRCQFEFYGRKPQEVLIEGVMAYDDFGEENSVDLDGYEFTITSPFRFESVYPRPVIGDIVDFTFNITNNVTQNLTVDLVLMQEEYFEKLDEHRPKLEYELLDDNLIRYNQTRSLNFRMKVKQLGQKEVPLYLSYELDSKNADFMIPLNLNITQPESSLHVDAPANITGPARVNVSVSLDTDANISNASIKLSGPEGTDEFSMQDTIPLKIPAVRRTTTYTYYINVDFEDQYSSYQREEEFNITINPLEELYIEKNITNQTLHIKVVNPLEEPVSVLVKEENVFYTKRKELTIEDVSTVFSLPLREGGMMLSNTTLSYNYKGLNMTVSEPMMIDLESIFPEETNTTKEPEDEEGSSFFFPLLLVIAVSISSLFIWKRHKSHAGNSAQENTPSEATSEEQKPSKEPVEKPEEPAEKPKEPAEKPEESLEKPKDYPEKPEESTEKKQNLIRRILNFFFPRKKEEEVSVKEKPQRPHDREGLINLKQKLDSEITELLEEVNPSMNEKAYLEEQEYLEVSKELEELDSGKTEEKSESPKEDKRVFRKND